MRQYDCTQVDVCEDVVQVGMKRTDRRAWEQQRSQITKRMSALRGCVRNEDMCGEGWWGGGRDGRGWNGVCERELFHVVGVRMEWMCVSRCNQGGEMCGAWRAGGAMCGVW